VRRAEAHMSGQGRVAGHGHLLAPLTVPATKHGQPYPAHPEALEGVSRQLGLSPMPCHLYRLETPWVRPTAPPRLESLGYEG
jgi:hypothetical protein